jgi:hypothetical protein
MARSSRKPTGHLPVGPMSASGALLLSLILTAGHGMAAAPATSSVPPAHHAAAKADSAKSVSTAKPVSVAAAPASKPGTVTTPASKPATATAAPANKPVAGVAATSQPPVPAKTAVAPALKTVPRSRLVTLPTSAPTRATGMAHPELLRAELIRKAARPKPAAPKLAQAGAQPGNVASAADPRGAVTLTPAKPGAVPMGIPVGDPKLAANDKNAKGARVVAAAANGMSGSTLRPNAPPPTNAPTVAGGGPQVSKMTVVTPGKLKQGAEGGPTHAATVGIGKGAVPAPPALEDQVAYQYNALGRRDPFNSLLEGAFVGDDVGGDAPPDLGGLKVVGIMWGDRDQFAMVEDVKGNSYVLRRGDKVMNGVVEDLKRDAMVINITVDGQSQSVTVPITRKGEKSNANR